MGPVDDADGIGRRVARELLELGARDLVAVTEPSSSSTAASTQRPGGTEKGESIDA